MNKKEGNRGATWTSPQDTWMENVKSVVASGLASEVVEVAIPFGSDFRCGCDCFKVEKLHVCRGKKL